MTKHKSKKQLREEAAKRRAGSLGSDPGTGEEKINASPSIDAEDQDEGEAGDEKKDDGSIWCGVANLECTIT